MKRIIYNKAVNNPIEVRCDYDYQYDEGRDDKFRGFQ